MAHWANWATRLEFHREERTTTTTFGWADAIRLIELHARLPRYVPRWPTESLIRSYESMVRAESQRFRGLHEASKARFFPLSDPLDIATESHRQFGWGREEVYSDWLHWTLEQLHEPQLIGQVLGAKGWVAEGRLEIEREPTVAHGHENQKGRLDLLISDNNGCLASCC